MHEKSLKETVWNADSNYYYGRFMNDYFFLGFWYFSIFSQHVLILGQTKCSALFLITQLVKEAKDQLWKQIFVVVVQSLSHVWLFETPWTAEHQASLSFTTSQSLLKLMCIESVMPSNHLILCCALLLLPSMFPCIRVFSKETTLCIRWPKYWSFSFSISPSSEYSGLISSRIVWFDLFVLQGHLKILLQNHNSKFNSSLLNLLYGPTLTSVPDYWKNHTFDYIDLCQ